MAHGQATRAPTAIRFGGAGIAVLPVGLPHLDAEPSLRPHQATAADGYGTRLAGPDGGHAPVRRRPGLGRAEAPERGGYCHV